ncbi:probable methyltransferase TARBP1 [Anoplophora glabripennis]|uniref:probable methyltransferase TARBP1 n=1 Tax=Anoplophora glabripennis TaxID=217634 RepID=UPI000874BA0E|nr:probable methyltransferase TARBP1 [Anoplophora glabripennis]
MRGIVIKKDDRVEYCVCQEIYEKLGNATENPNLIKISTRMSSLESMLQIISENIEYADGFTSQLVIKYRTHFNKRYFPDSHIHLQKLRILQTLLTIYPFIKNQRQTLIDLIEESFCTEIHQPCVKQLMQWLLLCLVKDQDDDYFNSIKVKIDTASKSQPSTIVAFIMVLLHLTLNRQESHWFSAVEALIPWSMGAHFKLRVYSQAALKKLLEEGKRKNYGKFLAKYSYLEKSILSVIEASGYAFYETLKSDDLIFSVFQPEKYYSLETIYVDIPRLNGVTGTEWENILKYKFITQKCIPTYNENRSFSNSVTMSIENNVKGKANEVICKNVYNIQRKIDPWKNVIEEQGSNKQISEFILIASLIDKSTNLGGLSRTCEVFGIKQLVLNDIKILSNKEFKSLSMSSEDWVNAVEVKTSELKKFICEIRNGGYSVIGAEQTSDSICLDKYKFNKKTALVLGNEREGIPPDIIPILDACIEIPQFGMVRSLNVHVAGATFIWEYVKQHLIK